MDNTQSTSPDSSPLKSTPAKDSVQLHSTPTRGSAKETELPKEPAWLIVLKLLSGKEVYDGSSNSFQTKMKWVSSCISIAFSGLTLKTPNKNCSRQHFNFLLLSFEENKA